jgi:hypothetical protein
MSSTDLSLSSRMRVMQILAGSLVAGSAVFLGIVVFLVWSNDGKGRGEPAEGALPLVSLLSLGMLLVNLPIAFVLPAAILRNGLQSLASSAPDKHVIPPGQAGPGGPITDTDFLLAQKQNAMIVSMALFEGASFFGSIAYLLEASPFALAAALGGLVLLLVVFPTRGRVQNWLQQQRQTLAGLRARPRMGAGS